MPEIGHFRIFGCLTYSHLPSKKRTKLEATGEHGIFVGYDETSKYFSDLPSCTEEICGEKGGEFQGGESLQEVS